jgi:hypothetical protein
MSEPSPVPALSPSVVDSVAAGLFPSLPTQDRRERTLRLLASGLMTLAPWSDGRMVYIEGPR